MSEKDLKEPVSIGLSRRLLRKLDQACREEGRSRSNYVENVLRIYFGEQDEKRSSSLAMRRLEPKEESK